MMYKLCPKCGRRLKIGEPCPCGLEKRLQRQRRYDQNTRDRRLAKFYHSGLWVQTRRAVLAKYDWVDLYALRIHGVVLPADTVHHIIPVRDAWERRYDMTNLLPVSRESHEEIHREYAKDGGKILRQRLLKALEEERRRLEQERPPEGRGAL